LVTSSSPTVPSRLPAEQRRQRILDGAMEVFADRGYHGASMAEIARRAGITPAVIYDHFASKAELHNLLIDEKTDEILSFVGERASLAGEDPAQRLAAGVDAFFSYVETHPFAWRLIFRDPPADPEIADAHGRAQQRATDGIAIMLRTGAPPGMLESSDADQRAEIFAQLLKTAQNGLAAWWYEHREVPREVIVERVLEFAWVGLEQVAEGRRWDRPAPLAPGETTV
jgi:AcrR family transcriptional regulator